MFNISTTCRLCLKEKEPVVPIFLQGKSKDSLPNKIKKLTNLEVEETDGLPTNICINCCYHVNRSLKFIKVCQQSHHASKNSLGLNKDNTVLENGTAAEEDTSLANDPLRIEDAFENHVEEEDNEEEGNGEAEEEEVQPGINGDQEEHDADEDLQLEITNTLGNAVVWNDAEEIDVDLSLVKLEPGSDLSDMEPPTITEASTETIKSPKHAHPHLELPEEGESMKPAELFKAMIPLNFQETKHKSGRILYRCLKCNKYLDESRSLRHIKYVIDKVMGLKIATEHFCDFCSQVFDTRGLLKTHLWDHHLKCNNCGVRSQSCNAAKKHVCKPRTIKKNLMSPVKPIRHKTPVKPSRPKTPVKLLTPITPKTPPPTKEGRFCDVCDMNIKYWHAHKTTQKHLKNMDEKQKMDQSGSKDINATSDNEQAKRKCECSKCGARFGSEKRLVIHIACVHPEYRLKYVCSVCNEARYNKKGSCAAHLREAHNVEDQTRIQLLVIPINDKKEAEGAKIVKRKPKKEIPLETKTAKKQKTENSPALKSKVVHSYICCYCKNSFLSFDDCLEHLRKWHKTNNAHKVLIERNIESVPEPSPTVTPKEETESVKNKIKKDKVHPQLTKNIQENFTTITNEDGTSLLKCKGCKLVYSSLAKFRAHYRNYNGATYQCTHCPLTFSGYKQLYAHQLKYDKDSIRTYKRKKENSKAFCNVCNEHVVNLIKHVKSKDHHAKKLELKIKKTEKKIHKTEQKSLKGEQNAPKIQELKQEQVKTDPELQNSESKNNLQEANLIRIIFCKVCHKTFKTQEDLAKHEEEHAERKQRKCENCSQQFNTTFWYDKHVQSGVCVGPFPYQCESCPQTFNSKFYLLKHNMKKHQKRASYPCRFCHRTFNLNPARKQHETKVHKTTTTTRVKVPTKNESALKCPNCEEAFQNFTEIKSHVESKHSELTLTLRCVGCPDLFITESACSKHINSKHPTLVHEKPELLAVPRTEIESRYKFQCNICDFKVTVFEELEAHLKVHGKDSGSNTQHEPKAEIFYCKLCEQNFDEEDELIGHLSTQMHIQMRNLKLTKNKLKS